MPGLTTTDPLSPRAPPDSTLLEVLNSETTKAIRAKEGAGAEIEADWYKRGDAQGNWD